MSEFTKEQLEKLEKYEKIAKFNEAEIKNTRKMRKLLKELKALNIESLTYHFRNHDWEVRRIDPVFEKKDLGPKIPFVPDEKFIDFVTNEGKDFSDYTEEYVKSPAFEIIERFKQHGVVVVSRKKGIKISECEKNLHDAFYKVLDWKKMKRRGLEGDMFKAFIDKEDFEHVVQILRNMPI